MIQLLHHCTDQLNDDNTDGNVNGNDDQVYDGNDGGHIQYSNGNDNCVSM